MKEFNTEATCIPYLHYMVDISDKIQQIEKMIAHGDYFTINRARQYGKTTTMSVLFRKLQNQYLMVRMSFEGVGDTFFKSDYLFVWNFIKRMGKSLKKANAMQELIESWNNIENFSKDDDAFEYLGDKITTLCDMSDKEIVLMVDEVDKSSDNQVFLHFLGMLRNKYLDYKDDGDATFKSVILAGVYDIKNMKLKLRPDEEKKYNSPWNAREGNEPSESLLSFGDCPRDHREFAPYDIAVDFEVDMSFSPKEISTMLQEYEDDHHTGMDITAMSEEIYKYTNGYPYLVSWLCKWMDKNMKNAWNSNSIQLAIKGLLNSKNNTLFGSLRSNIENNTQLKDLIFRILYEGEAFMYNHANPVIELGEMFGIFINKNDYVCISNKIFEIYLYNYSISVMQLQEDKTPVVRERFIDNGKLNIVRVLQKFQELMKAEYRQEDETFLEKQGRLLFLCFIKPIINGTGFYYVESETRNNERMDLVITYGGEEHIIELKIWHGEEYRKKGIVQLEEYLDSRNADKGYLLSFSFLKNKEYVCRKLNEDETKKDILEVVV